MISFQQAVGVLAVLIGCSSMLSASKIVFLGDSLTSGFGLQPGEAFPELIAEKIRREDLPYTVVNAGVSGETAADGLRRAPQVLDFNTSVLVLALGANDGLRHLPVDQLEMNLKSIIGEARRINPRMKILLCGMRTFDDRGKEYAEEFEKTFKRVAKKRDVELLPFLLEGVGGVRSLNQNDRIHPTAEGQKKMAELVWKQLQPMLQEKS